MIRTRIISHIDMILRKDEIVAKSGFVQPYGDTPFDDETVGENVYLNMIGYAQKYIYVYTPYLITDNEMNTALKLATKRGVDVRIVTPGFGQKTIYWLTQSSYQNLLEAGVKIYQYTPGFIHSKCVLCDDEIATVGTINFDYRSFYHHFECGVFMYQMSQYLFETGYGGNFCGIGGNHIRMV